MEDLVASFSDQLEVKGAGGLVRYVVTQSTAHWRAQVRSWFNRPSAVGACKVSGTLTATPAVMLGRGRTNRLV